MTKETGKRLMVVALLLTAGGCEFLKKHVRITSEEHSPFAEERAAGPGAEAQEIRVLLRLPLSGEDGKEAE